jgi:hypothetical protein
VHSLRQCLSGRPVACSLSHLAMQATSPQWGNSCHHLSMATLLLSDLGPTGMHRMQMAYTTLHSPGWLCFSSILSVVKSCCSYC